MPRMALSRRPAAANLVLGRSPTGSQGSHPALQVSALGSGRRRRLNGQVGRSFTGSAGDNPSVPMSGARIGWRPPPSARVGAFLSSSLRPKKSDADRLLRPLCCRGLVLAWDFSRGNPGTESDRWGSTCDSLLSFWLHSWRRDRRSLKVLSTACMTTTETNSSAISALALDNRRPSVETALSVMRSKNKILIQVPTTTLPAMGNKVCNIACTIITARSSYATLVLTHASRPQIVKEARSVMLNLRDEPIEIGSLQRPGDREFQIGTLDG